MRPVRPTRPLRPVQSHAPARSSGVGVLLLLALGLVAVGAVIVTTSRANPSAAIAATPTAAALAALTSSAAPTIPAAPTATPTFVEPWAAVWSSAMLYAAPGSDAATVGSVQPGDQVRLAAWAGDWWLVHTPSGDGWLSDTVLIIDPAAIGHVPFAVSAAPDFPAVVVTNGGNLRASPDLDAEVIGGVDAGDILLLEGAGDEWWHVRTASGASWLHRSLVALDPRGAQAIPRLVAELPRPVAVAPKPNLPTARPKPGLPAKPTPTPAPAPPAVVRPRWPVADGPGNLTALLDVSAPHPYLAPGAVGSFNRVRSQVLAASGVDYLGRIDEAFRGIGYRTTKPGVADRSWHKAGRAVDVMQLLSVGGRQGVVFIRDPARAGLWRVLLRCARQDGALGRWYAAATTQGRGPAAYYVDVTAIFEREGWQRIPGNRGVTEAWHYEYHGGLTWRGAMLQLYSRRTVDTYYP